MKYHDSAAKSTEYLGPVLSLMARQTAAMDPVSYAVWYEYVAGSNLPLKAAIDEHLRKGELLNEKTTADMFELHVADIDEAIVKRFSEGFQKVMKEISSSVTQAGDQAGQFGTALEKWRVDQASSNPGNEHDADLILGFTRTMQGSIISLKSRLDESRSEIESLRQEVGKAREDALVDGLTGLVNRRGFDLQISGCLAGSDVSPAGHSLIMADIDHFKQINDTYGHVFGDKVIRAVAQILKNNVNERDTAARYGGEEFVVLMPGSSVESARQLAENIRTMVEKVRIKRGPDDWAAANISISLGVASFKAGESATAFVARADVALYASKNSGRNQVTVAQA